MTLEQKIRNSGEHGVIGVVYLLPDEDGMTSISVPIKVINDYEGVLEIQFMGNGIIKFLNGDNFYFTHEEAFNSEL